MTELAENTAGGISRQHLGVFAWGYFLLLTAAVVYPWFLSPGLLFLLDFVWPPTLQPPVDLWRTGLLTSLPHEWSWWMLSTFLSTHFVQKVVFSIPFFLSGISMFQLVRWIIRRESPLSVTIAALTAGTFYALNPFVVTRVFMGQLYLLLAYALMPWALLTFLQFFDRPIRRTALVAGLTTTGTMLTNIHHVILVPLLVLPFALRRRWTRVQRGTLGWFLAPVLLFILAATLLTSVAGDAGGPAPNPLGPWARALRAPWSGNQLVDAFALTANWKLDLPFMFPHEALPLFGLVFGFVLLGVGSGAAAVWERNEYAPLVRRLLLVGGMSAFLALGVAHPVTEPVAAWLYRNVPFFLIMRDSAKFLSLVALAESVLLGLGLVMLSRESRRVHPSAGGVLSVVFLAVTLLLVSPAFGGFGGQITPATYPKSWTEWNRRLAGDHQPRMLFLPWHQYLPFSFTDDRTVTNPAQRFFTNAEVIAGDNSEVGGTFGRPFIRTESTNPHSRRIEALLSDAARQDDLGSRLATEDIDSVALARDTLDSASYGFLDRQTDLRQVYNTPELTAWQVTMPAP